MSVSAIVWVFLSVGGEGGVVCVCVNIYIHAYVYMHTHTCTHIHIHVHVHVSTYTYTYTRTRRCGEEETLGGGREEFIWDGYG